MLRIFLANVITLGALAGAGAAIGGETPPSYPPTRRVNQVDTLHGTFVTVVSQRLLNEVRGQYSQYTDRRAAKCDCVSIQRAAYATTGGYDFGTWGVLPEETYDISDTVSLWMGDHNIKTGASFTYDVT